MAFARWVLQAVLLERSTGGGLPIVASEMKVAYPRTERSVGRIRSTRPFRAVIIVNVFVARVGPTRRS
jgi:hypothetical protein